MASPISSVTPIDYYGSPTGAAVTNIPAPSKYEWSMADVLSKGTNRSESMVYNKMRKGQTRSLSLGWVYPTVADAALILQAFNSEYVLLTFLDPKDGAYVTKRFTVGDRSVPAYNLSIGRWDEVSFTITQQDADEG